MSKCNFDIPFSDTAINLVQKLQSRIVAAGGSFAGDTHSGNFTVKTPVGGVEGAYTILAEILSVTIQDKPIFVGCNVIESFIRKEIE